MTVDITDLIRSTLELHERFGVDFDVEGAERLCAEEFRELIHASAFASMGLGRKPVLEESVDLLVVVLGLLTAHGLTENDLMQAIDTVIVKNDSKTHETHYVDSNGKITRRR